VEFRNGMTVANAVRMRFHYGRSYAADRFRGTARRGLHAAGSPLLPIVLTWRAGRSAFRAGVLGRFVIAFAWVWAFSVAWSAGEMTGYLCGRSQRPHIY
jgi:hypothetical protein